MPEDLSVKNRCRVIRYVMFVITLLFDFALGIGAWLQEYIPEQYKSNFVIEFKDFFSKYYYWVIYTPFRFL